ncbi:MAG TPA: cell wall hydrolase [Accumulibacter sp.]|uniref:cell wall hydrolase n=1 Tax=Accumulibacter sp. TaxID=2053492 RepID=UPI002CDEAD5C|nr:cell wall hydrolase [Accumulibacter sp.]HRD89495.1 cell wall hydrolase [Accumulibacter sp.]
MRLPRTAGSSPDTTIDVALRDGFGRRLLPPRVAIPGSDAEVALNPIRAARPIAQAALGIIRDEQPRISGTATCLVRDRLNPARNYLLTCGHVVAPDARARAGNSATIIDGDNEHTGYLAEWQPALGGQVYRTAIDAALIELKQTTATFLQRARGPIAGESLPVAVGSRPLLDKAVSVRRTSGTLPGALKVYWSGLMDMADLTPGYPDYFLNDGIGYAASDNTIAGDSGAAVWDTSDHLMGMHLAGLSDALPGEANAVLGLIEPVLEWFAVQPYLRSDPATLPVVSPDATGLRLKLRTVPAAGLPPDQELTIVAQTLWAEARGEGEEGMRAVACVIGKRLSRRYRGKTSLAAVCLDPWQFSCWNQGDRNRSQLERIARTPDAAYRQASQIARELALGNLQDITCGATHYVAGTLRKRPDWLRGKTPCKVIGGHEFYNDID